MNIFIYLYCIFHSANLFMRVVRPSFNEEIRHSKWPKISMWSGPRKERLFVPFIKVFKVVTKLSSSVDGTHVVIWSSRDRSPCRSAGITTEFLPQEETNLIIY